MNEELISLQKVQIIGWLYLLVLTLGSWWWMSWSFAWGVLAGGIVSIVSFSSSHKDVMRFANSLIPDKDEESGEPLGNRGGAQGTKVGFLLRFWLRIIVIGISLFLLIKIAKVNVFGLILGLSTMVINITFLMERVARRFFFSSL